MRSIQVKVYGIVQGVWFRKSTKETADKIGVKGVVKNMPDKSVYIEAEGGDLQMEVFLNFCKKGPEFAKVERLEIQEQPFNNYSDFKILS